MNNPGRTTHTPTYRTALIDGPFAARSNWERLDADHDFLVRVLIYLLEADGYRILKVRVHQDRCEEAVRACGMVLQRGSKRYLVLGLRQNLVVTSDVIGQLGRTLLTAQTDAGQER